MCKVLMNILGESSISDTKYIFLHVSRITTASKRIFIPASAKPTSRETRWTLKKKDNTVINERSIRRMTSAGHVLLERNSNKYSLSSRWSVT